MRAFKSALGAAAPFFLADRLFWAGDWAVGLPENFDANCFAAFGVSPFAGSTFLAPDRLFVAALAEVFLVVIFRDVLGILMLFNVNFGRFRAEIDAIRSFLGDFTWNKAHYSRKTFQSSWTALATPDRSIPALSLTLQKSNRQFCC